MPNNSITARIEFSFQGKDYAYSSELDLDNLLYLHDELPLLHSILAKQHGVDTYSYLYEVLESHDITFSEASGVAARSCRDGSFDWPQFQRDRREEGDWHTVRVVAERTLPADELDSRPELKAALLAVYRAGR